MTKPRSENFVWVTWLAKLMAGETQCTWAPWFRTHFADYPKAPSDFGLAQWMVRHTQALAELARSRESVGERTLKEGQNTFRVKLAHKPSLVLAGKPDLITIDHNDVVTVYDTKTGQPRQSHLVQVKLYMLCLPTCFPAYHGKRIDGSVVYPSGDQTHLPADSIDGEFKQSARYFADMLNAQAPPSRSPSKTECHFCDITAADCPERVEWTGDGTDEDLPSLDWDAM